MKATQRWGLRLSLTSFGLVFQQKRINCWFVLIKIHKINMQKFCHHLMLRKRFGRKAVKIAQKEEIYFKTGLTIFFYFCQTSLNLQSVVLQIYPLLYITHFEVIVQLFVVCSQLSKENPMRWQQKVLLVSIVSCFFPFRYVYIYAAYCK